MNLCTSVSAYVGPIGLYKRIVNADTQSIRIANADGHGEYNIPAEYYIPLISNLRYLYPCKSK